MFKRSDNKTTSLRFRRWSRAHYAVFCSLGTVVTIGCLAVSIADKAVQKSTKANTVSFVSLIKESADNELINFENDLVFQLTEVINLTSVVTDEVATKSLNLYIHPNG